MSCEKYQDALTDLVAMDAKPDSEMRAHLDACASCRSYMQQEQLLFASIDSDLRSNINAAAPGALVQRLQARLAQEPAARSGWLPVLAVAAIAAAAIILVGIAEVQYRLHDAHPAPAAEQINGGVATVARTAPSFASDRPVGAPNAGPRRRLARRVALPTTVELTNQSEPKVLVPPDQLLALAEYARTLQSPSLLARVLPAASAIEPIVMASNEIPELKVEPLPDLQSE
jgi:predicted anti-sigma-YlaC factor YlaD